MQYGHFDDEAREYVITRPDTPKPWSNYIGSAEFGGVVTNNAAGYTFYKSAAQGRLTRFRFNAPPSTFPGRFVYLRDTESGEFWSNSWMPVGPHLSDFRCECRHGTGYTVIRSEHKGIVSQVLYFAPLGELFEVWQVTVENLSAEQRRLSLFPFIEPQCNWNALDDSTNLQYTQYISTAQQVDGFIDIGSNVNMPVDPDNFTNKDQKRHTFFGLAGVEPAGFDADLAAFLGPYGSYAAPAAVEAGSCTGSSASGDMPCAAFQVDLLLEPGERKSFAVVFGVGHAEQAGRRARAMADSPAKVQALLEQAKGYWHKRLNTLSAVTPDAGLNSMVNTWAPYNNLMTFYWSRTASLVYAGERDGLGFRDTLQDIVGASSLVTTEAGERLQLMLTGQFSTGGAKPVVQPFHHRPGQEEPPTHYRSDDCLWFFNAVPAYVKEAGDIGFFRKVLPYADQGEATVLGHLRRALEFNLERSGAHGLPCGLDADWNDCLRLGEKGESVFVAMQLRFGLREYAGICRLLGEEEEAAWAAAELARLDRDIEDHAWDGSWYLRAYRYDGLKFGSKESLEGSIFMNPQAWAVLSGHAEGSRGRQVMKEVQDRLATPYGIMLCAPPYVETDPRVCLARLFNPGMKENGAVFNHTQGWAVMAAAELGLGGQAWEHMRSVLPSSFNEIAEVRQVEPYVVCQSTHSPPSPRFGAGRVSWLSGSAVWNYVAMTTAILGIKADYLGLTVDPCIPAGWPGFTAAREFRGARYEIEVENPKGVCKGVAELWVDGARLQGCTVPAAPLGAVVKVRAVLG